MSSIKNKAVLVKLRLTKFEGGILSSGQGTGDRLKLTTDWDYQVAEHNSNSLALTATSNVRFSPEALFNIQTAYTLIYRLKEPISQEEIRESIESLLRPAAEQNSLLVSQLTDKMRGSPMVIPPKVNLNNSQGKHLN